MGLDAFETGAHDAVRNKGTTSQSHVGDAVHILKGTDVDQSDLPDNIEVHEVERRELKTGPGQNQINTHYTCSECRKTGESAEAIIKTDKLEYRDEEWADGFFTEALTRTDEVSREEAMNEVLLESEEEHEEEEDIQPEDDGGLMSFKS